MIRLDIFLVYSLRQQHIFVLIRASLQKLRLVAEEHQVKMLLDEQKLKAVLEAGNPEKNIAPLEIPHDPSETEFRPHEYIAGRFRTEVDSDLYWRPDDISHPFRESVRLKLTLIMIELPPPCGGDCIQVRYVIALIRVQLQPNDINELYYVSYVSCLILLILLNCYSNMLII
jgi:hypothetical protein